MDANKETVSERNLRRLRDIEPCLWLGPLHPVEEDLQGNPFLAFGTDSSAGWKVTARELSRILPGQFWASNTSVTWVCGRDVVHLIDHDMIPHVLNARSACARIGAGAGGTVGACARRILEWAAEPERKGSIPPQIDMINPNYLETLPGQYKQGTMYDVQSCYWSLFCRLPSLRLAYDAGRIVWIQMTGQEQERIQRMKEELAREKVLRNTVVGVCRGGNARIYYCRGEKCSLPATPGPFQRAAKLIYRTAWELCRRAAEEADTVYACVDSVCSIGRSPSAWKAAGLTTRVVCAGWSDICRPGVYRVGRKATEDYRRGVRSRQRWRRPAPVQEEVCGLWL